MMEDPLKHPRRLARLAAPLALGLCSAIASADAVRLSGFWIENATIQSVTDGQLIYVTSTGGRVTRPLTDVEGLRLTNYPEVEQAQAALGAGEPQRAVTLLREAMGKSRQEWATRYMQRLLVTALGAAGGGNIVEAARTYADLVGTDPDPFFVPEAPVDAVAGAGDAVKARVRDALTPALARTPARYRESVEALIAAASAAEPAAATDRPGATTPPAGATPAAAPAGDRPEAAAVVLPKWADGGDPAVQMLRRGEFREAIETVDRQMTNPDAALARPLFYKGVAQLALAEQTGDETLYKEAGLNFMRIVTFYDPRTTTVPPAMVEAAYVHRKIGRDDVASRLLDSARALMDEEEDPTYYQRLTAVMSAE